MTRSATVCLTAYNTGFQTEDEFDAWAAYVAARIDEVTGLDVSVLHLEFGHPGIAVVGDPIDDAYALTGRNAGGDTDTVTAASEEDEQTIREALAALWERGCAESFGVASEEAVRPWTYEGYYATVVGTGFRPEADTRRGLDEWLGAAEVEAWRVGGQAGELPAEWAQYHARALDRLVSLCEVQP